MREVPSLRAGAAAAMEQLNMHLTPPPSAAAPPPAAPPSCEPRRCPWWPYTDAKEFKANTGFILVAFFCALIFALAFNAAIRYLLHRHCAGDPLRGDQKAEIEGGGEESEVPALIFAEETRLPGGETECVICLSDFSAGEKIRVLDRCNHGFHLECVQRWLNSRSSCPTCRTNCSTP